MKTGYVIAIAVLSAIGAGSMARSGDIELDPAAIERVPHAAPFLMMSVPRAAHAAVVLRDGRVAWIGGCVADGCEAGPGSRTVDFFDPKTGKVGPGGALAMPRIGAATAVLPDGRVLIAGGWSSERPTASVEIFDPGTGKGVEVGHLRAARADIGLATLRDGRIALMGGLDGRRVVGDVEIFDPVTERLSAGPSLRTPRSAPEAVRLSDGRVLVAGGYEGDASDLRPSSASEIADAALLRWSQTGRLAHARYKHSMIALPGGRALVVGGSDDRDRQGKISAIEAYDAKSNSFAVAGQTLRPRFKLSGTVLLLGDGRVFIGGGGERSEVFDPRTGRGALVGPSLGAVRSFSTVSLLADGRVAIAGGYEENTIAVSRAVWVFRP